MVTSTYFNNFKNFPEQSLIEDLIVESIKIFGHDIYYLPRATVNTDRILNEPEYSTFSNYAQIEMYIKNTQGFEGEGDFLSKFGLEIREELTMSVARRSFMNDVARQFDLLRPREGDVVYFPMTDDLFSIRFVEDKAVFYHEYHALLHHEKTHADVEYTLRPRRPASARWADYISPMVFTRVREMWAGLPPIYKAGKIPLLITYRPDGA